MQKGNNLYLTGIFKKIFVHYIYNCSAGVIHLKKDYGWKESNDRAQPPSVSEDNFIPA